MTAVDPLSLAGATTLPFDTVQVMVFMLASLGVGALLLAFAPRGAKERLDARMQTIAPGPAPVRGNGDLEKERRRQVEDTIRELQSKEKAKGRNRSRPTLIGRLRQAGLGWSRYTYLLVSAVVGIAGFVLAAVLGGLGSYTAIGFGIASALLLPHFYLAVRRARRFKAFTAEFPNALDTIVRGVQAGLPLGDCMRVIASEGQEPVRTEFAGIIQDQALGVPLDGALQRMTERVPLSEASFFAIVLAVQARTGGNLSEALSNLSNVLRDRKKMRMKIKAMSSEAKASAGIIGCLPVAVAGMLYLTSPDYIALLFSEPVGHIAIAGSMVWMLIGILVMRKMINFDF